VIETLERDRVVRRLGLQSVSAHDDGCGVDVVVLDLLDVPGVVVFVDRHADVERSAAGVFGKPQNVVPVGKAIFELVGRHGVDELGCPVLSVSRPAGSRSTARALLRDTPQGDLYPLGARAKRGCGGNKAVRALRGLEAKEVAALLRRACRHTPTQPTNAVTS
jgi:hypothetical protein